MIEPLKYRLITDYWNQVIRREPPTIDEVVLKINEITEHINELEEKSQ